MLQRISELRGGTRETSLIFRNELHTYRIVVDFSEHTKKLKLYQRRITFNDNCRVIIKNMFDQHTLKRFNDSIIQNHTKRILSLLIYAILFIDLTTLVRG